MRTLDDCVLDTVGAVHDTGERVSGTDDFAIHSPARARSKNPATRNNSCQWAWATGSGNFDWMDHHGPFERGE
jgi:hypothetical protein